MKWILIIILIFVIMVIAYAVSEQIKEKYDFYVNLKQFLQKFKLNISFKRERIIDFLNEVKAKKQFMLFVNQYKKYLATNTFDLIDIKILDDDEKFQLETIVKGIGNLDAKNEIEQIENFLLDIETKLDKAQQDKNRLCPMIIKLSLLFAIGLAILLV